LDALANTFDHGLEAPCLSSRAVSQRRRCMEATILLILAVHLPRQLSCLDTTPRAHAVRWYPMSRPSRIPLGCWPLEMRAETAAAYCDEPSVDAFLSKVERGIYSQPLRQTGCLPKWHRFRLSQDIACRHGLRFEGPDPTHPAEDITELI
jgi:hypothetical protein